MLQLLHIENIAVIERSNIQFDSGFNVLTGETGAGKSIVIDAISAILGARTYRDLIRTGAEKAFVSAVFTKVPALDWFADNGVPYDPDELLISRDIYLDGRNVCRVNGQMVTVAMLRKLGSQLIQIHGQHDSQQLFDEANHLASLDRFAANEDLRQAYLDQYALWEQTRKRISEMTMDEGEKLRRMETLQYQIQELEEAALQDGEEETLDARRTLLRNAERLTSGGRGLSGVVRRRGQRRRCGPDRTGGNQPSQSGPVYRSVCPLDRSGAGACPERQRRCRGAAGY